MMDAVFYGGDNLNPTVEPWLLCSACLHPIRGEHHTVNVDCTYGEQMVLHLDCARFLLDSLKKVIG